MKSKRVVFAFLGVLAVAIFATAIAVIADDAATIAEAQKYSDQEQYAKANEILMELAKTSPDNVDVYWMIARNFYDMGERIDITKDKQKKLQMYIKCEEWAKKGYQKNPGLADNAFWMAVGMSQQAQVNGIAATLMSDRTLAKRIEEMFTKATQAKEFHYREANTNTISSAHLALGMFYRKVPDSAVVKVLMGTKGDLDKSVEHLRKAIQMFPKNLEMNKELGVSLICRGMKKKNDADIQEGEKYLNIAMSLPATNALDRLDQADSKRLLADHSLACGYSRVQQEEVTDEQFRKQ